MRVRSNSSFISDKRSNRQGSKAVTGIMKARQNQQQGQCKGRGQAADREISTGRQGQKGRQQTVRVNSSPGNTGNQKTGETLRMSAGAKQDFAVSARK